MVVKMEEKEVPKESLLEAIVEVGKKIKKERCNSEIHIQEELFDGGVWFPGVTERHYLIVEKSERHFAYIIPYTKRKELVRIKVKGGRENRENERLVSYDVLDESLKGIVTQGLDKYAE